MTDRVWNICTECGWACPSIGDGYELRSERLRRSAALLAAELHNEQTDCPTGRDHMLFMLLDEDDAEDAARLWKTFRGGADYWQMLPDCPRAVARFYLRIAGGMRP